MPNFFFDRYSEAGISRTQFLVILHLARYQYESANSQCRPSVPTIAKQMGYTVRSLQKVLSTMQASGILKRHYRSGLPTIYDFTGFSYAVLRAELYARNTPADAIPNQLHFLLELGGEPQDTPSGEPQDTPVVNPRTPKEEKEEEQGRSDDDELTADQKTAYLALTHFGVDPTVAHRIAASRDSAQVLGWIARAEVSKSLRDPEGFVVRRLLDNEPVPKKRKSKRGLDVATCPGCSQVGYRERLCPDCGRCPDCCTCQDE